MGTTFQEKSAWIVLISKLVVFGIYFWVALRLHANDAPLPAFIPLFGVVVVLLVALLAAGHVVAAIVSRPEDPDERDRLIAWRAESHASVVLAVGVLAGIACLILTGHDAWTANVLLVFLVLSEVVKSVFQLVYYRRGVRT